MAEMQRNLAKATEVATGSESVRKIAQQVMGNYDVLYRNQPPIVRDAERLARISDQITTRHADDFARIASQLSGAKTLGRISEQLSAAVPPDYLRMISNQLGSIAESPGWRDWREQMGEASELFDDAAAEAAEEPEATSVGWWLASQPVVVQVAVLVAGLKALDGFARFLETASGEDIPDPAQAAMDACFALVAFLLLWMSARKDADAGEGGDDDS